MKFVIISIINTLSESNCSYNYLQNGVSVINYIVISSKAGDSIFTRVNEGCNEQTWLPYNDNIDILKEFTYFLIQFRKTREKAKMM